MGKRCLIGTKDLQLKGLLALAAVGAVRYAGTMRYPMSVALAILSGNGILLDHRVVRRVADLEAIFEGAETMPAVIVGRGIGGMSASPNARWGGRPQGPRRTCRSRHLDPGPC